MVKDKYNLSSKTIMIVDFGGYIEVAIEMAKFFSKVYYLIECREPFPKHHKKIIGKGVPNIHVIHEIEDYEDEVDLFYFCDLFFPAKQEQLRRNGRLVFGAGRGEILETDRKGFKELMKSLNMPVNKYETLIGVTALREYLKKHDDVYVKLNADMRGELESSHAENYDLFNPVINQLQHTLGFDAEDAEFLVEEPIRPAVEYGYDGFYTVGGYPNKTTFGIEVKDSAYCCTVVDYARLPQPVKDFNMKLYPILQSYDYRGCIGNEIRHQEKGEAYLIDIYCRQPQPPTSVMLRMIENYGELAWEIASGIIPNIKYKYKFGAQVIIKSHWAELEPQAFYFPEKYREFISIKNMAIKDGISYYIPQVGCEMVEIGSISCGGNTLKEAINKVKMIAKEVKGFGLKINCDAFDEAQEEISKLSKIGINLF